MHRGRAIPSWSAFPSLRRCPLRMKGMPKSGLPSLSSSDVSSIVLETGSVTVLLLCVSSRFPSRDICGRACKACSADATPSRPHSRPASKHKALGGDFGVFQLRASAPYIGTAVLRDRNVQCWRFRTLSGALPCRPPSSWPKKVHLRGLSPNGLLQGCDTSSKWRYRHRW